MFPFPRSQSIVAVVYSFVASLTAFTVAENALGQSLFDQIGYSQLQDELGASLPTGAGVNSALIEPGSSYLPNLDTTALSGKTIANVSNSSNGVSGHSTSSAVRLFGTTGVAAGVDNVDVYQADNWINDHLRILQTGDPAAQGYHVTSHSYIIQSRGQSSGDPDDVALAAATDAAIADLLQRFDFVNHRDNTVAFVGTNNGLSTNVPAGLTPAYNAIAVGRTDGNHAAGQTSSNYGGGRIKPDLVVPQGSSSAATPVAASAGAFLIDSAGIGTAGARNQVIRATLLAGATKEEFADWDRTTTRPLDERYGAGELNIYNSYQIQQGGQQDGSSSAGGTLVGSDGWDFVDDFDGSASRLYTFQVAENRQWNDVSIALAWNREGFDANPSAFGFTPVFTLADFNLRFLDENGSVLQSSQSTVDNVEHIFFDSLATGTYQLEVTGDLNADYGLAWRGNSVLAASSAVPEPSSLALIALVTVGGTITRRRNRR